MLNRLLIRMFVITLTRPFGPTSTVHFLSRLSVHCPLSELRSVSPRRVEISRCPMMYLRDYICPTGKRKSESTVVRSWHCRPPCTLPSSHDSIPSIPPFTTSTSFIFHRCTSCHGTLRFATLKEFLVLLSLCRLGGWMILILVDVVFAFSHLRSPNQNADGPYWYISTVVRMRIPRSREPSQSHSDPVGGWTLGNIDTENAFCTNMCKSKACSHHSISQC